MAESGKVFNDCVHGHIELDPLCVKIVDTPQFQRLRNIKQLGGSYYVYPGASHNRFEHSIGVYFLAGQLIETLKFNQPDLKITPREVRCVKIAGLCHDLGHGPFSHLFDEMFLPKAIPGYTDIHEKLSTRMFDHLLDENGITVAQLNNEDREFIKRLILGDNSEPDDRMFLYEIIANKKTGIDVDKWDYFARDCYQLGITSTFDHMRLLKFARVIRAKGDGKRHICFRDKVEQNIYNMFYTRSMLHRRAYKHGVTQAIEIMLTDALLKANDHLMIYGSDRWLKMSECVNDMVAFSKLTDNVYYDILHGEPRIKDLGEAADILRRIEQRDLYRCISQTKPRNCLGKVPIEEISKRVVELSRGSVEAVDFEILVVKFDYGMGEKNPVDSVLFYEKNNPNRAVSRENMGTVSLLLPTTFYERILRFFWKKKSGADLGRRAFEAWLEEDGGWQKSGN